MKRKEEHSEDMEKGEQQTHEQLIHSYEQGTVDERQEQKKM
ncbi:hypothetical protein [Shouchella shacheensis]|nr:hypothetical protein [Shouchella shacheensis]